MNKDLVLDALFLMSSALCQPGKPYPKCMHSEMSRRVGTQCQTESQQLWHWFTQSCEEIGIDLSKHGVTAAVRLRMLEMDVKQLGNVLYHAINALRLCHMAPINDDPVIAKSLMLRMLLNNYDSPMRTLVSLRLLDARTAGFLRIFADTIRTRCVELFATNAVWMSGNELRTLVGCCTEGHGDGRRLVSAVGWAQIGIRLAERRAGVRLPVIADLEAQIMGYSGFFIDNHPRQPFVIKNYINLTKRKADSFFDTKLMKDHLQVIAQAAKEKLQMFERAAKKKPIRRTKRKLSED
jgi:hypothetical protein